MMFLPISKLLSQGRDGTHLVAIRGHDRLTFAMLQKDVQARLKHLLATQRQTCVLSAKDSYEFIVDFLALMHAGWPIVLPANSQPETLQGLKSQGYNLLIDGQMEKKTSATAARAGRAELDELATETTEINFYTSGSTGDPKRIEKTLQQLEAEISVLEDLWGDRLSGCTTLCTVTHQHIYGLLFKVLWPLSAGRPFVVETFAYWEHLAPRLHPKSCIISSPAHLARYPDGFKIGEKNAPEMIFCSGASLQHKAAKETTTRLKTRPVEVFGSTETGGIAHRQQQAENTPWTAFKAVQIAEDAGVLKVRSPYLDTDSWYQMNDLVCMTDPDRFHLLGRNDRIVKVEGKRVSLPEIETALIKHDWVDDASVLVLHDARKSLAAVVVLSKLGANLRNQHGDFRFKQKLRIELRGQFEMIARPKRWRFVEQVPQTPQGKRLHHVLLSLFDDLEPEY